MQTILDNRYTTRLQDGESKWYVWKSIRDLNTNATRSGSVSIKMLDPLELLPAIDLLEEHGLTGTAAMLRELVTPQKPSKYHNYRKLVIDETGHSVTQERIAKDEYRIIEG
ncbi:MAG: hypothetical protein ACI9HK_004680 [Pirellulaceae bacterium]|jgi:hypothetical protein